MNGNVEPLTKQKTWWYCSDTDVIRRLRDAQNPFSLFLFVCLFVCLFNLRIYYTGLLLMNAYTACQMTTFGSTIATGFI